jgi:DNA-binding IclR family transcriptional regulator
MTKQQILALQSIGKGIIESANLHSTGAPGGAIYSALMSHGASFNQFQQIMSTLVRHGFLSHDDDSSTYHATEAGLQWAKKV